MTTFKQIYTLDERKRSSDKILKMYPEYIPIVIESGTKNTPAMDNKKFIFSKKAKVLFIINEIRKRIKISPDEALFIMVGDKQVMPMISLTMEEVYNRYHDEDGFLYIKYSVENTFGIK